MSNRGARMRRGFVRTAARCVLASSGGARGAETGRKPRHEEKEAGPYDALAYRFIGPPGNRVSSVVGVPGDPNTYYVGAASGGVWKSIDGGRGWKPGCAHVRA